VHVNIGADMSNMGSSNDPIFWIHHSFVDKVWWTWQKTNGNAYNGRNPDGSTASISDRLYSFNAKVSDTFDVSKLCYTYQELQSAPAAAASTPAAGTPPAAAAAPDASSSSAQGSLVRRDISTGMASGKREHQPVLLRKRNKISNSMGIVVEPDDREELVNLRHPNPLPDQWCIRNHIDPKVAASQRDSYGTATAQINAIEGYIPICSLWHREDVLTKLAVKQKRFIAVVSHKEIVVNVDTTKSYGERATHLKNQVRTSYGGYLHKDVSVYHDTLSKVVGQPVSHYGGRTFYTNPRH